MSEKELLTREDCLAEIAAIDGATPAKFRRKQLAARVAAMDFIEAHPEFYPCSENIEQITDWMISHNLLPTVEHFEIAAAAMDAAGLLLAPGESEDAPPEPSWTMAQIDAMPSGEYKQKLRDPKFAVMVEKLLAASKARPQPIRR